MKLGQDPVSILLRISINYVSCLDSLWLYSSINLYHNSKVMTLGQTMLSSKIDKVAVCQPGFMKSVLTMVFSVFLMCTDKNIGPVVLL